MCDVGVKKFTIFFKIKIYKKTCKKFCRLQKDLYLCSVNKTTKHMINLGYKTKEGYIYRETYRILVCLFDNDVQF